MTEVLFEHAPSAYFAFTDDARLVVVNKTLTTLLDSSKEVLLHRSVEILFTLPTRIFFQTHFFPLIRMQGHAEEIFLTLITSGGRHVPVLLNARRMEWEGQLITCCSCITVPNRKKFEDELVTARKTAEQALADNTELRRTREELLQQATMLDEQIRLVELQNQELRQFSHVVTHNLKEPLRKIILFLGRVEAERSEAAMDKLVKAAAQLKSVVTALQQYVWLSEQPIQARLVQLKEILAAACRQVWEEAGTDVMDLTIGPLDTVEGDAEQLQLLFYHLLSNAVKFRRGETARIRVEATTIRKNSFRKLEHQYRYVEYVRIQVRDEGTGFDPVHKEQIFELFRKLSHSEGQGLGLALCRKIAENHNGYMEAMSEPGNFTVISIWIPDRHYTI